MNTPALKPIQERIAILDVLRGFALFGVLLVNMLDFSSSALRTDLLGMRGNILDQMIDLGIAFFAVTKFYLLFSFLFGVGFAVQMRRTTQNNRPFIPFYLRRLAILLVIGLVHSILIWDGDILRLYAIAGAILLIVRNWKTPVLVISAGAILLGGLILFGVLPYDLIFSKTFSTTPNEAIQLFKEGSYYEVVAYRLAFPSLLDIQMPMVMVMFLVGLIVGREGLLDQSNVYTPFLRRWWKWALPFAIIGNTLFLAGFQLKIMWMVSIGIHIGAPLLSFVYVAWVILSVEKLQFLAPVGQLALSNYLSQSLISTTLFYGYGLGFYDEVSPTFTLIIVLVFFGTQILLSREWLKHYRFGLMEWVWRSLSYGEWQPIRKKNLATSNTP